MFPVVDMRHVGALPSGRLGQCARTPPAVGLPQASLHETRTASSMPDAVCYHLCYHMETTVLPAFLEILVSIEGKVPRAVVVMSGVTV